MEELIRIHLKSSLQCLRQKLFWTVPSIPKTKPKRFSYPWWLSAVKVIDGTQFRFCSVSSDVLKVRSVSAQIWDVLTFLHGHTGHVSSVFIGQCFICLNLKQEQFMYEPCVGLSPWMLSIEKLWDAQIFNFVPEIDSMYFYKIYQ